MIPIIISVGIVLLGGAIELFTYFHAHSHRTQAQRFIPDKFRVGGVAFWSLGDRVLIEEDEFKSGYECTVCEGRGKIECTDCDGIGERNGKKCSHCESTGDIVCPTCAGKGGLLIAPETAQRRPTSGTIVSAGYDVQVLKTGDTVLYSNFAGYVVDLNRSGKNVVMRILHESEILTGMEGHLTLNNMRGKSDIAIFNG